MTVPEEGAFAEERRREILRIVSEHGRARIDALASSLRVSAPTIRKDLRALELDGLVRRTHGGALRITDHESNVGDRRTLHFEAKNAIAREAARLIESGESAFLDSGTTVQMMAGAVTATNVNILTNSLGVATTVADMPNISHTLVGGSYRSRGGCTVGPVAMQQVQQFRVSKSFIGVTGLTAEGITCADIQEAELKSRMIDLADRVIVLMDSSKFGAVDFARIAPLGSVDVLIVEQATDELSEICRQSGTELLVARDPSR
jgi:DeoR/GlpR family transcriptional regulator of sugar metabolism